MLVFDADEGGLTGVDRALEIFVSQDLDLAIATLPARVSIHATCWSNRGRSLSEWP